MKPAESRLEAKVLVSMTRVVRDRLDAHCEREGVALARFVRKLIERELGSQGEDNADASDEIE